MVVSVIHVGFCFSCVNEILLGRVITESLSPGSVAEEHTCFSVLLWYLGLGKLCFGKRQQNFIGHFPELSTCSFLEYSLFGSGKVPCFDEHICSGNGGCFDDLLAS